MASASPSHGILKQRLAAKARALGFDLCRVASPDAIPETPERLATWIESGAAGDMDWMAETARRRGDPRILWPDVRSIVMLGLNYGPAGNPLANLTDRGAANVSVYARHRDYHDVIKGRLKELAGVLAREGWQVKVFVDTAPVMEKPLAAAAGLGWQGKHTNLVARDFGSWLFLGSVFTDAVLDPDPAERDHCGSCQACLDICPTAAFPGPYQLDARRCLSYLTIEHQGHIPREFRRAMGNRIYGCDDCLAICPWNKYARQTHEIKLAARADMIAPRLADWLLLSEAAFRQLFAGSPVKRVGHARFLRNLLIAAGNSGEHALLPAILPHLRHASPLVRAMAVWALGELETAANLADLDIVRDDPDPDVRAEWAALVSGTNENGNRSRDA